MLFITSYVTNTSYMHEKAQTMVFTIVWVLDS